MHLVTYGRSPITDSVQKHVMSVNKQFVGQNKGVASIINHSSIQPKLQIGAVNDPQEKEADSVADKVVLMQSQPSVQRKCQECEREEDTGIQAKLEQGANAPAINSFNSASGLTASGGTTLPSATNKHMSDSIGFDFSAVRVHNDKNAEQLNQQLHSRAFTYGKDIYFNQDQYQPSSSTGQHLLAHELTHVVQQSRGGQLIQKQDAFGPPSEIPLASDVGAFWFRANENGRIEFVYGTPVMPAAGERGVGIRCENGICSPIISGTAGIGELGDTYTVEEAMALLRGEDPDLSTTIQGGCAPAQRNALGICCPSNMIANGLNCDPLPAFVPTLPGTGGIPSPDGSLTVPQLGDSLRPGASVFPLSGLATLDNFGFNQHSVPASADAQISDLALRISILSLANTGTVFITGYADAVGEDRDNMQLGLRRANAIKQRLIAAGVPASSIVTDSEGESNLVVQSDQAEPRNRRVEVFYTFSNLHVPPNLGSRFRLTTPANFGGIEPGPF